jgi:hypothetical protein
MVVGVYEVSIRPYLKKRFPGSKTDPDVPATIEWNSYDALGFCENLKKRP